MTGKRLQVGTVRRDELSAILHALAAARPDLTEGFGLIAIAANCDFEPDKNQPPAVVKLPDRQSMRVNEGADYTVD